MTLTEVLLAAILVVEIIKADWGKKQRSWFGRKWKVVKAVLRKQRSRP